jgi:hypothetical protein
MRAPDDAHSHGGSGRRIDPALHGMAASASDPTRPAPIPARPAIAVAVPLTVTDANVMLGKLQPGLHFPKRVRAQWQDEPLDADTVRREVRGFGALAEATIGEAARLPEETAEGFITHRRREHGQRHQEDLGAARL